MFIEPMERITRLQPLGSGQAVEPKPQPNDAMGFFRTIFEERIQDVIATDNAVAADVRALATGESDDLHTLGIDQAKAQLSLSLLVQIRNRFVESYNELMRINI